MRRASAEVRAALVAGVLAGAGCEGAGEGEGGPVEQPPVRGACEAVGGASDPFADCVDAFTPRGATFGQERLPEVVLGPPQGGGELGGLDVLSLGCGGEITLFFDGHGIVDGPGPDLRIFENPFALGDVTFVEPARVLVSDDGMTWYEFACDLEARPPVGCAGVGLVWPGDDPEAAGGDAFDLADLGLARARWLRLIDVGEAYYGDRMWCEGASGGFDLDAAAALHGE